MLLNVPRIVALAGRRLDGHPITVMEQVAVCEGFMALYNAPPKIELHPEQIAMLERAAKRACDHLEKTKQNWTPGIAEAEKAFAFRPSLAARGSFRSSAANAYTSRRSPRKMMRTAIPPTRVGKMNSRKLSYGDIVERDERFYSWVWSRSWQLVNAGLG